MLDPCTVGSALTALFAVQATSNHTIPPATSNPTFYERLITCFSACVGLSSTETQPSQAQGLNPNPACITLCPCKVDLGSPSTQPSPLPFYAKYFGKITEIASVCDSPSVRRGEHYLVRSDLGWHQARASHTAYVRDLKTGFAESIHLQSRLDWTQAPDGLLWRVPVQYVNGDGSLKEATWQRQTDGSYAPQLPGDSTPVNPLREWAPQWLRTPMELVKNLPIYFTSSYE